MPNPIITGVTFKPDSSGQATPSKKNSVKIDVITAYIHQHIELNVPLAIEERIRSIWDSLTLDVFEYDHDFDANGVCYHLGYDPRTDTWRNPAEIGKIRIKSSPWQAKTSTTASR